MKRWTLLSTMALLVGAISHDIATGEGCSGACHQCGCGKVRTVCRLAPDVKKTTTFCYSVRCEDFCVNGRSECIGTKEVCDCRGSHCERIMKPTCREVLTRRYVVKTPIVEEKHGWKCVVETVCCGCGHCCAAREANEAESKLAATSAEQMGADPATASGDIFVPFDDQVTPTSATEPVQARKSRFIDLLFGK